MTSIPLWESIYQPRFSWSQHLSTSTHLGGIPHNFDDVILIVDFFCRVSAFFRQVPKAGKGERPRLAVRHVPWSQCQSDELVITLDKASRSYSETRSA